MWFSRRLAPIRGLYNENDDYAVTTFFSGCFNKVG